MISDAQKRATAKYRKDNLTAINVRIRNEDMLKLQQVCLTVGIKPGAAARMYLQSLANESEESLVLLRRLAADDMPN